MMDEILDNPFDISFENHVIPRIPKPRQYDNFQYAGCNPHDIGISSDPDNPTILFPNITFFPEELMKKIGKILTMRVIFFTTQATARFYWKNNNTVEFLTGDFFKAYGGAGFELLVPILCIPHNFKVWVYDNPVNPGHTFLDFGFTFIPKEIHMNSDIDNILPC